jgi:hypothetical protein
MPRLIQPTQKAALLISSVRHNTVEKAMKKVTYNHFGTSDVLEIIETNIPKASPQDAGRC